MQGVTTSRRKIVAARRWRPISPHSATAVNETMGATGHGREETWAMEESSLSMMRGDKLEVTTRADGQIMNCNARESKGREGESLGERETNSLQGHFHATNLEDTLPLVSY